MPTLPAWPTRAMLSTSRIGLSKWELETPALCVDLDGLETNIARMQAFADRYGISLRPHAKTHKCAAIASRQLEAGAIGISAAKLGEAEALFAAGIEPICLTTSNVTQSKIRRAMALAARNPQFIQAVDYEPNARDLSAAAQAAGVVADVVIDVALGARSGVPPGEPALSLAKLVDSLPHLRLRGLLAYDGSVQHIRGHASRRRAALAGIAPARETRDAMDRAGLSTEIFSGGGTGTYDVYHDVPGFTDLQVGSYVFMDMQYLEIGAADGGREFRDFLPSLSVLATVLNDRFAGRLTTDAGAKSIGIDIPTAGVVGEPGMTYDATSDEFGAISFTESSRAYRIGDRLEMIVPHCDPAVNLYDVIHAIRDDRVEAVWPVTARGRSQ